MAKILDIGVVVAFEGDLDKAFMLEDEMEDAGYTQDSAGFGGSIRDIQLVVPDDVSDEDAEKEVRDAAQRLSLTLDYVSVYDDSEDSDE